MSDLRRRYLAQQVELGGAEAILDAPLRAGRAVTVPGRADRAEAAPIPDPAAGSVPAEAHDRVPSPMSESAMPKRSTPPADAKPARGALVTPASKWRQGAPPIPESGLTIAVEPSARLDELQSLGTLEAVAERIRATYCCGLCPKRTHAVPGEGNPEARFVVVGEGPGATEDATGRPFVGQAGQLLDNILQAIELPRESVYITNVVKCRPPNNRKPTPDEMAACLPYLHRQLELLRPKVMLAMGGTAAEALLGVKASLGALRGKVHRYNGIPLVVTYHPAALLRNPTWKKPTWDDVRIARQLLDR